MEVNNNLTKIKLILQYVYEGKITISENYTEKLIKFLDDGDENSPGKLILETPCISNFVYYSLVHVNNTSTSAKVILLRIVTIIFKNELQFNRMQIQGFKDSIGKYSILHNLRYNPPPCLHLSYIELATVHIAHRSGLKVVMEYGLWKYILQPNIHHKPRNIYKAAYNFVAKLVLKLEEYNLEVELIQVLENIIKPILNSEYLKITVLDEETDKALCDNMFPYLCALLTIFNESNNIPSSNKVTSMLIEYFHVDHKLFKIYLSTKNEELLKLLNACWLPISFASLRHLLRDKNVDEFCNRMAIAHRNYLVYALNKSNAPIVIDYITQSCLIWSGIEKSHAIQDDRPLTFERYGHKKDLSLQIVVSLIVPLLKHAQMLHFTKNMQLHNIIEPFLLKISKNITEYIYSCCYMFASLLEEKGTKVMRQMAIKTVKELLRLKEHLNESQAGPIFQSLYYTFGVFIIRDEAGRLIINENTIDQEDLILLSQLMEAMKMLLKEYTITWYENVEIVNVQADIISLLNQKFVTPKQIVQALDLLDICVSKFLSPNMTLLVENNHRQDEIGEVIKKYVQHEEWEVRDSAFNLLNTCTDISFIKYVPLQTVIKEYNLLIIAANSSHAESEFYPQCTALKCLAAATKVNSLWQEVLVQNVNIYFHLVTILKNHAECMVRKEAAKVLTAVYVNQKMNQTLHNTLYEVMIAAALDDLHWEVQLAALNFWSKVIHNHLTDRGMLDGKFPIMTFSKAKRKIVVMNAEEIIRQLLGALNDLSKIGCLTVLLECMNEIHHIDVMVLALSIAKELVAILDMYKVEIVNNTRVKMEVVPSQCAENTSMDLKQYARSNEAGRNKVIDSILRVNQADLLINIHNKFYKMNVEEMDASSMTEPSRPRRKLVNPNQFLDTFRDANISLLIDNKKGFSENSGNLSSLLDDILHFKAYYPNPYI